MHYRLSDRFIVEASPEATWAFFSQADNLPKITPPSMHFRIDRKPAGGIEQDSLLEYTVRVGGLPMKWRSLIVDWSPPTQFIDLQLRGPYALWHHRHTFKPVDGGTECADQVVYRIPFGPLGRVAQAVMVRKQLLTIFQFRRQAIERLLGPVRPVDDVTIKPIRF